MWLQSVVLRLRRVPRAPWRPLAEANVATATPTVRIDVTELQDTSVAS